MLKNWLLGLAILILVSVAALTPYLLGPGKKTAVPVVPTAALVSQNEQVEVGDATKKEEKKREVKKEVRKKKVVKRDQEGWLPYLTIGRNPYCPYRTDEMDRKILRSRGYSEEEVTEYLGLREKGEGSYRAFFKGEKFLWVVFGDARVVEKLRAVWNVPVPGVLYQLKTGRNVVVLDECCNLAEVPPRPVKKEEEIVVLSPVVVEPEASPLVVEEKPLIVEVPQAPAPPIEVLPVQVSPPEKEEEEEKEAPCWIDPKLVAGYEGEPSHNGGDDLDVVYASSAVFCMWRMEDNRGDRGLGLAFQGSLWGGDVNREAGHFKGYLLVGGPAYQETLDEGRNWEARLLFGVLDEKFKQDGYKSHRRFGVVGLGLVYNDYRRWLEGYEWFPKHQAWVTLLTPFTSSLKHSFNGEPIMSDPPGLDLYLSLGGRLYLYDNDYLLPYIQGGFFAEIPGTRSLSLRVGVSDPNFIFGIGIGPDINLVNGGEVFGWGFWFDAFHLVRTWRDEHLANQLVDVTDSVGGNGGGVVVVNGIVMVSVGDQPNQQGESQNSTSVDPQDTGGR
jgi:hypothetical protein